VNPLHRRHRLHKIEKALTEWAQAVPREAVRFHEVRGELLDQCRESASRWWRWGEDVDLRDIENSVATLEEVAAGLRELEDLKTNVQRHIDGLATRAQDLADEAVGRRVDEWCLKWRATLARQGTHVERRAELQEDRAALQRLDGEVHEALEGLNLLIEASVLRERFLNQSRAAKLQVELDKWKAQFRQGPTPRLLTDIDECLAPLRGAAANTARTEEPPTDGFRAVRELLFEARRWIDVVMTDAEPDVAHMDRDLHRLTTSWSAAKRPDLDRLFTQATAFVASARTAASEWHHATRARLYERQRQFHLICPARTREVERLDDALAGLGEIPVDSADRFRDFADQTRTVTRRFDDLALPKRPDLALALTERAASALAHLEEVQVLPLSSELAAELGRLRTRVKLVQQLGAGSSLNEIFNGLSETDECVRQIDTIKRQADEAHALVNARRAQLAARFETLRRAARSVGRAALPVGDVLDPDAPPGEALEVTLQRLDEAGRAIVAAEQAFIADCGEDIVTTTRRTEAVETLLARIDDADHDQPAAVIIDADIFPEQIAELLDRSRANQRKAIGRLRSAHERLIARLQAAEPELAALMSERGLLSPEELQSASQVRTILARSRETTGDDSPETVSRLFEALVDYGRFRDRVKGDEVGALQQFDRVQARLRQLSAEGFLAFHRGLAERCSALLEGVRWESRQWHAIAYQLSEAEQLLDRLEVQGRRRVAVEIDEGSATLRRDLARGADAERARRIERTLAALDPYARVGALPPFPLREQIKDLVGRRQEPRGL
jgi:hypothetical protein